MKPQARAGARRIRPPVGRPRRRGAVAAQVAVSLTTLVGFMALAVDVGMMYNSKAELQRCADASALAAAAELGDYSAGDPLTTAYTVAGNYASQNQVLNAPVGLADSDVVFGRAYINEATGRYVFEETENFPNAVRVIARRTEGSPSGPLPLFFANVFGLSSTNISARATAVLTPRDIAFVLDLSGSHNDDSSLRSFKNITIANRGVWESLWDEELAPQPSSGGRPDGPKFGNMQSWGDDITGPGWDWSNDAGLLRLPKGSDWALNSATVSQTLESKGYGTYTASEMSAINSDSYDGNTSDYQRRVLVALGVYRWKSGKSGGQSGGNGDNRIDSSEIQTMIPYPSSSSNPATFCKDVGGSWTSFVDYVRSSSSNMCQYSPSSQMYGDPDLRYRYGLKTFVDYLQEKQTGDSTSPGMRGSPAQPMKAVLEAVDASIDIVDELDGDDLVGVAGYGTQGYGPDDKPNNLSWLTDDYDTVRDKVAKMQAAMWTPNTNIAQGIDEGVKVLFNSAEARPNAAKVILLLTDGIANQTRANPSTWNEWQARLDTVAAAQDARARGVRIYTVSVGANADEDLMSDVAGVGKGEHFHAEGEIDDYRAQLDDIFRKLGGKRPVVLIE